MKRTAGAWIGLTGGLIGLIIALGAILLTPGVSLYAILGPLLIVGGVVFLVYRLYLGPLLNQRRLQREGEAGMARILEVKDTGITINNQPQVKLILEVRNRLGMTYTAECRVLVSRIHPNQFLPGMELAVRIDPKNEKNVVIDRSGPFQSGSGTPSAKDLQEELEKLQQEQQQIAATGRPARAIVKRYTWLGAYVNGNNPYVELELEIIPDQAPAFSGKARGVIGEAAVAKFQPGEEIFVKYDLYDNSRVVIERS
jgi:hypothetical protein